MSARKPNGRQGAKPGWQRLLGDFAGFCRRTEVTAPSAASPTLEERVAQGRALAAADAADLAAQRALDAAARAAAAGARVLDAAAIDCPIPLAPVRGIADQSRLTPAIGVEIVRLRSMRRLLLTLAAAALAPAATLGAQDVKIRDLTITEGAAPIRLMGYGLAVGLDGSGDRGLGGRGGGMTVQSVVNLLRNFNVEIPADLVRTRNVAAVLVTAEVSPYLRAGGRFEVHVASLGDARSLRGGVLYMTPLLAEAGGRPVAAAQGAVLLSEGNDGRDRYATGAVETTARIPSGGQLEADLPRPTMAQSSRLLLKEPDVGTASRIAAAINGAVGAGAARVEDEGAVALALPDSGDRATLMSRIRDLAVRPERASRIVIDARDGTVVAGGDLTVGAAVVSHGAVTLTIGDATPAASAPTTPAANGAATPAANASATVPGDVRVAPGTSVQRVASALHAVQTPPNEIAAIFAALREVGALAAEVVVR